MSGYVWLCLIWSEGSIKLIEVCTLREKLQLHPLPLTNLGLWNNNDVEAYWEEVNIKWQCWCSKFILWMQLCF